MNTIFKITCTGITLIVFITMACSSSSEDVMSLEAIEKTSELEDRSNVLYAEVENEAEMIAFTKCMRDQGVELKDPVVDQKGFIQKPEFPDNFDLDHPALTQCLKHLEKYATQFKKKDQTKIIDELMKLAICLRGKGFDVDDPKVSIDGLDKSKFGNRLSWKDPAVERAVNECEDRKIDKRKPNK